MRQGVQWLCERSIDGQRHERFEHVQIAHLCDAQLRVATAVEGQLCQRVLQADALADERQRLQPCRRHK